jgi:hypothetical protein
MLLEYLELLKAVGKGSQEETVILLVCEEDFPEEVDPEFCRDPLSGLDECSHLLAVRCRSLIVYANGLPLNFILEKLVDIQVDVALLILYL